MKNKKEFIQHSVIRDMSEGVVTIGLDGKVTSVNPAAEKILEKDAQTLVGRAFARSFFEFEENDSFNQTILDAVYDASSSHESIVPYFTGSDSRQLHVTTSYLKDGDEKIGVIAVLSDISELVELRDAVKAMERIKTLNGQLEMRNKLLSETFGRFLSDEIVRQLLETPNGLALGGKKRELTVMMSDLRGFTAMSERMAAQDLLSMLNHYLAEMTDIIQKRNGTIIEFIGDGIMAIFGAPLPSDVHAEDAVAAAVEMQSRMAAINEWNAAHGYETLEMGIGLNTGEVIVGNIGSEKRTKYGVTGANVNLCGRIESYTVGGQILVSPTTREKISAPLNIEQEIKVMPKGVGEPIVLSHVTGIGAPYNVFCASEKKEMKKLAHPVSVIFFTVNGKHISQNAERGTVTAVSSDGAILESGANLSVYANVKLDICGDLFAKVTSKVENIYNITFTAKPDGFDEWIKTL